MIITRSRNMYKRLMVLRAPNSNHSFLPRVCRTPAYLDWIQIAFIRAKMKHVEAWTKRKREIASHYKNELSELGIGFQKDNGYGVYWNFVISIERRDRLQRYLKKRGIETYVHFPEPLHFSKTYRSLGYQRGDFPVSEKLCDSILSLPCNPFLTDEETMYVIDCIRKFFS
jgi:dTDP-4-amino-4,6-dideoxygalactose transaminase